MRKSWSGQGSNGQKKNLACLLQCLSENPVRKTMGLVQTETKLCKGFQQHKNKSQPFHLWPIPNLVNPNTMFYFFSGLFKLLPNLFFLI